MVTGNKELLLSGCQVTPGYLGGIGKERLVLQDIDLIAGMTAPTGWVNLWPRIHNLRCRAVSAHSPGLIGDMGIGVSVAFVAADAGPFMPNGDVLLRIVDVADIATAVAGQRAFQWIFALVVTE